MVKDMTAAARSGLSQIPLPFDDSMDGIADLLGGFEFEAAFRRGTASPGAANLGGSAGNSAVISALREVKESIEGFRAGIGREIAANAPAEIEATIANPRAFARALNR